MEHRNSVYSPEPGDILIRRVNGSRRAHALCVVPHAPQVACRTYDEALARATRFAETGRVDVWRVEGQDRFARVACHRAVVEGART